MTLRSWLAAALLPLTLAAPSYAAAAPGVDVTDSAGDVVPVEPAPAHPDAAERASVDVSRFTARLTKGAVRFTWTVAAVTDSRRFQQVFSASFTGTGNQTWSLFAQTVPTQPRRSTAVYSPSFESDEAIGCRGKLRVRGTTVVLDVPLRCVPKGAGTLIGTVSAGRYVKGEYYSRDSVEAGRVRLR